MRSFEHFLLSLGLRPREIVPGRWVRCPTETHPRSRNGSYKLADDGQIGWAMDFAVHSEPVTWRPEQQSRPVQIDRRELARRRAAERRARQQAAQEARDYYAACEPLRGAHPYLEAKGLSMEGCRGLKRDPHSGVLVIPMFRNGGLASVQTIADDGSKRFWAGASTKGASYQINRPGAALSILCEGLATGLSLFAAVPHARVVVAFNAGNMATVAPEIGLGMCVVAADNDHRTAERLGRNPGVQAATEAAEILGCGVAIPECAGADWNDYYSERLAELLAAEATSRRPRSEAQLAREIHAEIRAAVMRQARLRRR